MSSIVISPFWQGVDQQWIGATLIVLAVMSLLSTSLFLVRSRSVSVYLVAMGLVVLSALLLAPKADSLSPKMFQLWLMSPETLTSLSILQILMTALAVFGSIRQESCPERKGRFLHELRSWLIAAVAVLPQPILLVFIFWVEQNMMIETRQEAPVMIGAQVAVAVVATIGMLSFILSWFGRYFRVALHCLIGFFMVTSGALLPCLTIKLSFQANGARLAPDFLSVSVVFIALLVMFIVGFRRSGLRRPVS